MNLNLGKDLIPNMYRVRQVIDTPVLEYPELEIELQMEKHLHLIKPDSNVGVAVGSRGIYNSKNMVKKVVEMIKKAGANPCIIPAMGSHGGATVEGQTQVLHGYGITEEEVGAPIKATMETVELGTTKQGVPVHFDKNAAALDGIIMLNRVKPHTDFHGDIESGICKQMVIGLGKQKGAAQIHRYGIYGLSNLIPASAKVIVEKAPILMGVAILENAQDTTARIEVMTKDVILQREPELLKEAKSLLPSLPYFPLDVLIVQEMGKDISGVGIDPNITGRYLIRGEDDDVDKSTYRIVCLDLTEASHHNGTGIGLADVIPERLNKKIDLKTTYTNVITSGYLERGFLPIVAENDFESLQVALSCCNRYLTKEDAKMIFIKNTLDLHELLVSEAVLNEIKDLDSIEVVGQENLEINEDGELSFPFK